MNVPKVLEHLRAMSDKRLTQGMYQWGGAFCIVGALLPSTRKYDDLCIQSLYDTYEEIQREAEKFDLTQLDLMRLQKKNDSIRSTNEDRYEEMLAWIERDWE